jgi:N-methylhydantoinase B/oxoprolinase/acetone carboxylase alpha subunit
LHLPGGGGLGDPHTRDVKSVQDDVIDGLITADEARRDYGVAIDPHGKVDQAETARLRQS